MEPACIVGASCFASQSLPRGLERHKHESEARIIDQG